MNLIFGLLAILCGAAIALNIVDNADSIKTVTGLGIAFAGIAAMAPADWAGFRRS